MRGQLTVHIFVEHVGIRLMETGSMTIKFQGSYDRLKDDRRYEYRGEITLGPEPNWRAFIRRDGEPIGEPSGALFDKNADAEILEKIVISLTESWIDDLLD